MGTFNHWHNLNTKIFKTSSSVNSFCSSTHKEGNEIQRGIICEQFHFETPIKPFKWFIYGPKSESSRFVYPSMWPYCETVGGLGKIRLRHSVRLPEQWRKLQFAVRVNFKNSNTVYKSMLVQRAKIYNSTRD